MKRLTVPSGKLRSPWMGVPIPGRRPIVLMTDQVRAALTGVTITDVAVVESTRAGLYMDEPRNSTKYRAVEVTYVHGKRGRGRAVFYDRTTHTTRLDIHRWADKLRENRHKPAKLSGREGKIAQQIKRLEKEKKSLWLSNQPPVHPFLHRREQNWIVGQMPDQTASDYLRESEQRWHDEKPKRKELARIAGMWLKNKLTSATAYKLLRETGWEATPVSKLRTHDRERRPYQDDYWKHLPEFVRGVASNVAREGREEWQKKLPMPKEDAALARHAEARLMYLETRRQAQAIDNQIAAIRELSAAPLVLTEPPATDWKAVRASA